MFCVFRAVQNGRFYHCALKLDLSPLFATFVFKHPFHLFYIHFFRNASLGEKCSKLSAHTRTLTSC